MSAHASHERGVGFTRGAGTVLRVGVAALALLLPWRVPAASPVTALAFDAAGRTLASAGGGVVTLHHLDETNRVTVFETGLPKVHDLTFRGRGSWLAVAGGTPGVSGVTLLLDLERGGEMARWTHGTDVASGLCFDPEGGQLAVAADQGIRVYAVSSGVPFLRHECLGHVGAVLDVAFAPDGRHLVSVGRDRSVKVWSASDGRLIRSFSHHTESVQAVVFRPCSTGNASPAVCATAGEDRTVRVWQPALGRMVRIVRGHEGSVLTLAYGVDGRTLFTAGSEGTVRCIDADSDVILHSWRASDDWIYALAASPEGRLLATGDWLGAVSLWTPEGVLERRLVPGVGVDASVPAGASRVPDAPAATGN